MCLPFFDKVIIGTSDLPIEDPDSAKCTPEEEQYFIELVDRVFPTIKITKDQIVFRFSGVRPLEYMKAKTTGQITRDHSIKENYANGVPIYSLVGGKWTSFRAFSEQVADKVFQGIGLTRKGSTAALPVRGGKDFPLTEEAKEKYASKLAEKYSLTIEYSVALLTRYGTNAEKIAEFISTSHSKMLKSIPNWNAGELIYILKHEKPVHLEDVFIRRSTIAWLGNASDEVIEEFADLMADEYKWNNERKKVEISRMKSILD